MARRLIYLSYLTVGVLLKSSFGIGNSQASSPSGIPSRAASAAEGRTPALASLLNADGTLNLAAGFSGSLDASGWRMTTTASGKPRFLPLAPQVAGDEKWGAQFYSPGVNGNVKAIAVSGTDIDVGGQFSAAGNILANGIAKFNTSTSTWSALGSGITVASGSQVSSIKLTSSDAFVGVSSSSPAALPLPLSPNINSPPRG